jgi:hypothetical protein
VNPGAFDNYYYGMVPNTCIIKYKIPDLNKAVLSEQVAFCQWGTDYEVEGERPSGEELKVILSQKTIVWPRIIFPYAAEDFWDYLMKGKKPKALKFPTPELIREEKRDKEREKRLWEKSQMKEVKPPEVKKVIPIAPKKVEVVKPKIIVEEPVKKKLAINKFF